MTLDLSAVPENLLPEIERFAATHTDAVTERYIQVLLGKATTPPSAAKTRRPPRRTAKQDRSQYPRCPHCKARDTISKGKYPGQGFISYNWLCKVCSHQWRVRIDG